MSSRETVSFILAKKHLKVIFDICRPQNISDGIPCCMYLTGSSLLLSLSTYSLKRLEFLLISTHMQDRENKFLFEPVLGAVTKLKKVLDGQIDTFGSNKKFHIVMKMLNYRFIK